MGLDDPGHVGALVRTAHASGAAALVAVDCTDPFYRRAVRTSMGGIFRLPVLEFSELGRPRRSFGKRAPRGFRVRRRGRACAI
ncbi:MAG: tRNA G18 (ribose-2'-O)-methylase SpoU [Glaciecola sp.]